MIEQEYIKLTGEEMEMLYVSYQNLKKESKTKLTYKQYISELTPMDIDYILEK